MSARRKSSGQGAWGRLAFSIGWFREDLAEEETFEQRLEVGEEVSMQFCAGKHVSERGQMAEAWRQEYASCVRLKEQRGAGMAGSGRTVERDEVKAVMGRSHGRHLSRGELRCSQSPSGCVWGTAWGEGREQGGNGPARVEQRSCGLGAENSSILKFRGNRISGWTACGGERREVSRMRPRLFSLNVQG